MEDHIVRTRSDGYINIMDIHEEADKLFIDYLADEEVREFMRLLAEREKISIHLLIQYNDYTTTDIYNKRLWVHPNLAIHFVCCVSPDYFLRVTKWIRHLQKWSDSIEVLDELYIPRLSFREKQEVDN